MDSKRVYRTQEELDLVRMAIMEALRDGNATPNGRWMPVAELNQKIRESIGDQELNISGMVTTLVNWKWLECRQPGKKAYRSFRLTRKGRLVLGDDSQQDSSEPEQAPAKDAPKLLQPVAKAANPPIDVMSQIKALGNSVMHDRANAAMQLQTAIEICGAAAAELPYNDPFREEIIKHAGCLWRIAKEMA